MKIYDLTHTIRNDMPVYPGTEQPRLTTACTIEEVGYRETLPLKFENADGCSCRAIAMEECHG